MPGTGFLAVMTHLLLLASWRVQLQQSRRTWREPPRSGRWSCSCRPSPERPIHELRQYGVGAQILADLGLRKIVLITNSQRNIVGLEGYGIEVVAQQPIPERFSKPG